MLVGWFIIYLVPKEFKVIIIPSVVVLHHLNLQQFVFTKLIFIGYPVSDMSEKNALNSNENDCFLKWGCLHSRYFVVEPRKKIKYIVPCTLIFF